MGLTAAQKKTLRRALQTLLDEVSSKGARRIAPNRTDASKAGGDEDEQPLNEMLQAIASDRNRASGDAVGRAQRALERLDQSPDDAGTCEDCGEDIPWGRLKAMPKPPRIALSPSSAPKISRPMRLSCDGGCHAKPTLGPKLLRSGL